MFAIYAALGCLTLITSFRVTWKKRMPDNATWSCVTSAANRLTWFAEE